MQVLIHICAMDEERGVKSTRETVVDVPGKVIKLFEILGGGDDEIMRRVGDTVFAAAMRELQAGRVDVGKAMAEAGGGRIGGRGRQPVAEDNQPAAAGGVDPLSSMLGLEIIRNQVKRERGGAPAAPAPRPATRQPGPGPVGFPR